MKLHRTLACRLLCLALLGFAAHPAAHAQASVYGTFSYAEFTFNSSGPFAPIVNNGFGAGGFLGGATYEFPVVSQFTIGIDLRGSVNPGTTGSSAGTASVKFTYKPTDAIPRPYAQVGLGDMHAHTPAQYAHGSGQNPIATADSGLFQYAFGIDLELQHGIDLRLIEIGFSTGLSQATGTALGVSPLTYSIGVVVHIPHTSKLPWYDKPRNR